MANHTTSTNNKGLVLEQKGQGKKEKEKEKQHVLNPGKRTIILFMVNTICHTENMRDNIVSPRSFPIHRI